MKKDGSSFLTKEYLDDGRVRTRYFGSTQNPVTLTTGYAVLEETFNAANQKTGEAYFNAGLSPVYRPRQNYNRYTITYEADGKKIYSYYSGNDLVKTEVK